MKQTTNYCNNCIMFKTLYTEENGKFNKEHLGICKKHNHIGYEKNCCPYWSGEKASENNNDKN